MYSNQSGKKFCSDIFCGKRKNITKTKNLPIFRPAESHHQVIECGYLPNDYPLKF
jgi:hypothetical protein